MVFKSSLKDIKDILKVSTCNFHFAPEIPILHIGAIKWLSLEITFLKYYQISKYTDYFVGIYKLTYILS